MLRIDDFIDGKDYALTVSEKMEKSALGSHMIRAFIGGGMICLLGEILKDIYLYLQISPDLAGSASTMTLIFFASLLTGLGVYDKLAVHFQAGMLLPVTGFANGIAAIALEHKKEGFIYGLGGRMFQIAGPVILYGTVTSMVVGLIHFIISRIL